MAIYKHGREFELGTTEHKSSKWPERDSNPGSPDCESDALTTRPRCLPSCRTYFCCFHVAIANTFPWPFVPILSNFFEKKENSKPPTMPFRIVACTFPDNHSRNSYNNIYSTSRTVSGNFSELSYGPRDGAITASGL